MIDVIIGYAQHYMLRFSELFTLLLNAMSFIIIIIYTIKATIKYVNGIGGTRETIFSGISIALSYNLAGEVIKLIFGRSLIEFATIGAIILVKAGITLLMRLELKDNLQKKENRINKVDNIKRILFKKNK